MAWASPSGWGLSDLVSTVGETLKQYESVVDQAMGVPATKAGKKEETASASTPPSRAEPDTVDVVIPDADAAFMAPRTPSPPPVQAAPQPRPSPSSSQMRSPAPSRPQQASADFSLEDLLGSPFGASTAANATPNPLSGAAPAASVLADPLRLFGTFLASPAAPAAAPTPTPLSISAVPATPAAPVAPASPAPVAALPSSVPALSSSPPSALAQPPSPRPTPSDTPAHPHTPAPAASPAPVAAPAASSPERLPSPVAHSPALSDWPGLTPTPAHTPALTPAAATAAPSPPPALSLPTPTPTPIREATPPPAAPAAAPHRPPAPAAAPDDEVRRLREALMQRERQLETLNAAGAALQDTNAQLLAELERERLRHTDLDRMAGEFGGRITELERRLAAATRERDALRKERETSSAGSDAAADELNKARGEVAQLRAEGEALSRRQLALEEAAKKNRKRMKEDEATIGALNERVRSMEALLETKAERLKVAEENNRKYDESVGSLRALNESLTKRLDERTRAAEAAQAQLAEAQAALEKSWRELAEQRRLGASAEERTESVSKETEAKLREEARSMLAKQERDFAAKEADLHQAMLELRATIARNLERAAWREDELRKELADVQQRMQEAQAHTQELKALNAESTRPLLRQIDALQQSHLAKQQVWDQLETSLTARVHEAEERAQLAVDKERAAVAALNELSIRVRSLESQLGSERGNAARLAAELDLARSTADEQLKAAHARQSQAEVAQRELDAALRDARSREARLQQEARDAALRAEARVAALEKRIADGASAAPSVAVERSASGPAGGAVSPAPAAGSAASVRRGPSETSLVALGGSYGLAPALEKLQAVASQREGEIASLQEQLGRVERERSALAEELVSLTTKVSQLQAEVSAGQNLRTELAALKQRHTAALELLGEKEEKLDELKADLVDMKQLYRSQITEMVEKNAQLATQLEELKKEKR